MLEAAETVLRRLGRMWQVCYLVLRGPEVLGMRPQEVVGEGYPV